MLFFSVLIPGFKKAPYILLKYFLSFFLSVQNIQILCLSVIFYICFQSNNILNHC